VKHVLAYVASMAGIIAAYVIVVHLLFSIVDELFVRVFVVGAISIVFIGSMASLRHILRHL